MMLLVVGSLGVDGDASSPSSGDEALADVVVPSLFVVRRVGRRHLGMAEDEEGESQAEMTDELSLIHI